MVITAEYEDRNLQAEMRVYAKRYTDAIMGYTRAHRDAAAGRSGWFHSKPDDRNLLRAMREWLKLDHEMERALELNEHFARRYGMFVGEREQTKTVLREQVRNEIQAGDIIVDLMKFVREERVLKELEWFARKFEYRKKQLASALNGALREA